MKKVKRIYTINDCLQKLHYILYNFYATDLLMHKQGVVYEIESYQKKTFDKLKVFFSLLKKVIEKTDKKEIIKILQEKEDNFVQKIKEANEYILKNKIKERIYTPEKATASEISVTGEMLCERIKGMLKEEPFAEKSLKEILELEYYLTEKSHKRFRKKLQEYGYVPKKEKVVKKLKR